MKKIILGTVTLFSILTLAACSNNSTNRNSSSSSTKSTAKTEQSSRVTPIEFYSDGMKSDRIYFITDGIAKDSRVLRIVRINKGNITSYQTETDAGNGLTDYPKLGDFKDLSNDEVLTKAKELDSKAVTYPESATASIKVSVSTGRKTIPLIVTATTDSTGNNIITESFTIPDIDGTLTEKFNSTLPNIQIYNTIYTGYQFNDGNQEFYYLTKSDEKGRLTTKFDSANTKGISVK